MCRVKSAMLITNTRRLQSGHVCALVYFGPQCLSSAGLNIHLKVSIYIPFDKINYFLLMFGKIFISHIGSFTSCSVEWKERTPSVVSYNTSIFSVVFAIPLILIFIIDVRLIFLVYKMLYITNLSDFEINTILKSFIFLKLDRAGIKTYIYN